MSRGRDMRNKFVERMADTNKELLLVFTIIAFAGVINFFVSGQRLVLTFYNLPTIFAAHYFCRRPPVQTALASILIVRWVNTPNPVTLATRRGNGLKHLLS